ncbi:hypothetical protein P7L75_00430 (plasmid) [Tistrella mobilis]|uniref:hypothetical protein n=1 Tax=Tistrella mobilis TaxID=171437 RepID=UPI0035589060
MDAYTRLIADLGLPGWISEVRNGHWLVDAMVWEAPADWYTCPPALVPLTSDGSGPRYVGIWVRWTDAGRVLHFVEAGPEDQFLLLESALTVEQFAARLAMHAMSAADDVTDDIRAFAAAAGIVDLDALDRHTTNYSDHPRTLIHLPLFDTPRPATACAEGLSRDGITPFAGDTPSPEEPGAAWFELSGVRRAALAHDPTAAPWQRRDAPVEALFADAMAHGDHLRAWAILNSTGWKLPAARKAATALAAAVADPVIAAQLRAWVDFSQKSFDPDREDY